MTKKTLISVLIVVTAVIAGVLITSAVYALTGFSLFTASQRKTNSPDTNSAAMVTLAYSILENIKDDDFAALSHVVHPEKGIVLSPYATINLDTNRRFSAEETAAFATDSHIYVWGVYNGSGEPIEMTPAEYFAEFIPAADFMDTSMIGINQVVRSGNALENMTELFENVQFIDFHLPGADNADQPAWSSLRLGFEEYKGQLWLVTIVYSTWTA